MDVRHFMLEKRYVRLLPGGNCWLRSVAYHPPTRERVDFRELDQFGEEWAELFFDGDREAHGVGPLEHLGDEDR